MIRLSDVRPSPPPITRSPRPSSRCSRSSPTSCPPTGAFLYEPKWDGFRAIVFRGGADVFIQSRDLQAARSLLSRAARRCCSTRLPDGCVVDGEIVIATPRGLDFDALQLRLHPAASRVAKLAQETPAAFVAFDLLAVDGARPARRGRSASAARVLEQLLADVDGADPPDADDARSPRSPPSGSSRFEGAGLDGVIAKPERRRLRAGQARDDQGQARAHRRLRRRRLPLAQGREGRRWSARCCSASTTTAAGCTTSA